MRSSHGSIVQYSRILSSRGWPPIGFMIHHVPWGCSSENWNIGFKHMSWDSIEKYMENQCFTFFNIVCILLTAAIYSTFQDMERSQGGRQLQVNLLWCLILLQKRSRCLFGGSWCQSWPLRGWSGDSPFTAAHVMICQFPVDWWWFKQKHHWKWW